MGARDEKDRGIFLSRGVSLRIANIQMIFGPDGAITMPDPLVQVSLSMTPFWLEIALSHLAAARRSHEAMLGAAARWDEPEIGQALEAEFVAGMQAIVAACTALDALYASVKLHVDLPAETIQAWRGKRTPRYAQVAEVLRRAFKMKSGTPEHGEVCSDRSIDSAVGRRIRPPTFRSP